jgi:hypothetical protein
MECLLLVILAGEMVVVIEAQSKSKDYQQDQDGEQILH